MLGLRANALVITPLLTTLYARLDGSNQPFTGRITINAGTATSASQSALSVTQTWNNAAVTFSGIRAVFTDTASDANSAILDLLVGATLMASVTKSGFVFANAGFRTTAGLLQVLSGNTAWSMSTVGLSGASAVSLVNFTTVWNTTGTPSALKVNVTDTASNAASLLQELQLSTVTKYAVRKDGSVGIGSVPTSPISPSTQVLSLVNASNYVQVYAKCTSAVSGAFFTQENNTAKTLEFGTFGSASGLPALFGVARGNNSFVYSYSGGQLTIGTLGPETLTLGTNSLARLAFGGATAGITAYPATAIPAGGTTGLGYMFSSTANFGVFFGSGVPTLSAGKGSLYLRSDGTSTNDRAYINTDGATAWTPIVTVA